MQALSSRVPGPEERARFMSVQSVVQHLAAAAGAFVAAGMLRELPGGRLERMDAVAWAAAAAAATVPALMWLVESRVRRREQGGRSRPGARPPSAARPSTRSASGSPAPASASEPR